MGPAVIDHAFRLDHGNCDCLRWWRYGRDTHIAVTVRDYAYYYTHSDSNLVMVLLELNVEI